MPSSARETSRFIAQSWNAQPADVKAGYQSRADQAQNRVPSHSSPGRGQRVPFTTSCHNTTGNLVPQVPVFSNLSGMPQYAQNGGPFGGFASFDPAAYQLDAAPPTGPIDVSLGSLSYDTPTSNAGQTGNFYSSGYQDASSLAAQIVAYNIPYHELQLVASSANVSSSAQFSAGYTGAGGASSYQRPEAPSIQQYLSTLSATQVQAVRAYVQQYIASLERRSAHNYRG